MGYLPFPFWLYLFYDCNSVYPVHCAVGWSDFEKNATFSMFCQIVVGPKFQISCLNVAFSLVAGPQKFLFYFSFLKVTAETKFVL